MDAEHYMQLAIDDCRSGFATGDGGPFGACIVKHGSVIASGHNCVLKNNDPTAHAEIITIRRAADHLGGWDLTGCEIYSTTEPCPMCFAAIHWARIGSVFMGTRIEDVAAMGFNELRLSNEQIKSLAGLDVKLVEGVALEECRQLLSDWKSQSGASTY